MQADEDGLRRRIQAFDRCHTKEPLGLSDDELRSERLSGRYGLDAYAFFLENQGAMAHNTSR